MVMFDLRIRVTNPATRLLKKEGSHMYVTKMNLGEYIRQLLLGLPLMYQVKERRSSF